MKYKTNIQKVAKLHPEYLGFIFYNKSKRNFEGNIAELPKNIKKVGVFVDADVEEVLSKIEKHNLDAIQLHGDESPEFCKIFKNVEVIKVFPVGETFDFKMLDPYENVCNYFLFDTKGKEKGGNGVVFDWKLLEKYPSKKPYFLSGGIGLNEIDKVLSFLRRQKSKYCYAIDVNSKFELKAGLKDLEKLTNFIKQLK
ncbi:MAG: phosphoribosylanthranilate isomerase [Flavobacteriaceae bacterium]|nr:phosphoribosylanthranilate isomerase [Flavobacteriaceae bacterium]